MKFVENRIDEIIERGILTNKRVLEFGCVGMGIDDEYGGPHWIHGKVKKVAKKLVGLDLNKKGIAKLKKLGYNVKYQNIEEPFDLKQKFDVVLVEEVLEHLNNVGQCFDNIKRHLKKNGILVVTSPNAQGVSFFLQRLIQNKISGVSISEHTHWYDESTLRTTLKRQDFKVLEFWSVQPISLEKTLYSQLLKVVWSLFPQRVGRNIMCIAKKN